MKPPLCISAISAFLGLVLYLGYLELGRFTGGKLKKLEELDKDLAEKLDDWHPLPERWRIAGRLSIFICLLVAVLSAFLGEGVQSTYLVVTAALVVIAFLVIETASTQISLIGNARILCVFIPVFHILSICLFPLTWLIAALAKHAIERDVEQNESNGVTTTEDEILSLIDKKDENDAQNDLIDDIQEDERRMIEGAFELDNKTVHEIMTPRVDIDAVDAESTIEELTAMIIQSGHSRIPIYKENIDQIIGVIFAKDLLDKEKVQKAKSLEDLIRPPFYTPESKNIGDLLADFQKQKTHFAIVIDEYGGTSGIVTFEDILEEIVGEIQDEYDVEEPEVKAWEADPEGWYTLDARTPITEVNEQLEIELPDDEDYDTLGGYLSSLVGKIPQKGEKLKGEDIETEILEAIPRCVKKVRIRKLEKSREC